MKIFNDKKFIRMEVIRLAQRGRKPKPTADENSLDALVDKKYAL